MATLTLCACLLAPASAFAGGCETLDAPADRASCVAKQQAREAARAEVQRQVSERAPSRDDVGGAASSGSRAASSGSSAAWRSAMHEADGVHLDTLLGIRALAAVLGLAWFALVVRARWRRRRRSAART